MGLFGKLNPFSSEKKEEKEEQVGTVVDEYGDGPECAVCGKPGAEKKWAGQVFHKKCLRKARKMAKGMV